MTALLVSGARADDDAAFVTLDRSDGVSRAGIEVSYVTLDSLYETPRSGLRFELHGQSVNARTGFGVYESIPVGVVRANGTAGALGDVELGGLYATRLGPSLGLAVHAGGTLPSSPSTIDDAEPNVLAFNSRLADSVLAFPHAVSLRLGGSLLYRRERLFARVDLGADVNLTESTGRARPVIRIAGGAGIDLGTALLAAELVNLVLARDGGIGVNAGAVSARVCAGRVQPYAALIIPIDGDARQQTSGSITVGLDVLLP